MKKRVGLFSTPAMRYGCGTGQGVHIGRPSHVKTDFVTRVDHLSVRYLQITD